MATRSQYPAQFAHDFVRELYVLKNGVTDDRVITRVSARNICQVRNNRIRNGSLYVAVLDRSGPVPHQKFREVSAATTRIQHASTDVLQCWRELFFETLEYNGISHGKVHAQAHCCVAEAVANDLAAAV